MAEIVRSGIVEGHHYGSVVALRADGTVEWSVGDVSSPVLPRSSNKPIQALAMVEQGVDLPPDLLALACASHSGEAHHLEGVRRILAGAGLDVAALQTPADWPLDEAAREAMLRAGGEKSSLAMNCSGKHAAMLATCVHNGWDTASYLDPQHPLQVAITATFERMTGEKAQVAVDGCGAPLLSTSLVGLARAFSRLAVATDGPERRVAKLSGRTPSTCLGRRGMSGRCSRPCLARSGRPGRSPATQWRWLMGGRSRSRPTTVVPGRGRWSWLRHWSGLV